MNDNVKQEQDLPSPRILRALQFLMPHGAYRPKKKDNRITHPFWVIVQKEVRDHVKSWRFIILIAIILLTCIGT